MNQNYDMLSHLAISLSHRHFEIDQAVSTESSTSYLNKLYCN